MFSQASDSITIKFPAKYNLELKNNQKNDSQILKEWIPKKETFENYSIIATQLVIKNGVDIPFDLFKDKMIDDMKNKTINFKYTELQRADNSLIFKCEADSYKDNNEKESQIYFLTKGKKNFIINIVALKQSSLSKEFTDEWLKVFNDSRSVE